MSPEIKAYLELVVREFDKRLKLRGDSNSWKNGYDRRLKLWEHKVYYGAKELLKQEASQ